MPQFVWLPAMCNVFLWLILVVWVLRNWENNSAKLVMLHLRWCFDEGFSLSVEISESVLKCLSSRSTLTVMRTVWGIICIKICLDIFGRQLNLFWWLHTCCQRNALHKNVGELLYESLLERTFLSFVLRAHQPAIHLLALLTWASPRWTARKEWDAASSFSSWPFCSTSPD